MNEINRVLIINSFCGKGSTGHIVEDLSKEWTKRGVSCVVAYGRDNYEGNEIETYKIGSEFDIKFHGVCSRVFDLHGCFSNKATIKFIKWIEVYKPDLIHLHNLHGYYINVRLLFEYIKQNNIPVLWTLHDCWAFTGHCAYFDSVQCNKWIDGCFECEQKKEYPASYIIDNSKNNYLTKKECFQGVKKLKIFTPSDWLKGIVSKSFLSEYCVDVQLNGIDLDIFKYTESDIKSIYNICDKRIVLGVANVWDDRKGLASFLYLSKFLPDDWVIVLVGLTSKQIKGLPKNIIGITRTTNICELVKWYSAADIYFNSSIEETMGMTTIEALACGTPVIAFNKTAIPEVVDEKYGKIINDIDELNIETIELVANNKKTNYRPTLEKYSKQRVYNQYVNRCIDFYLKEQNE